MNAPVHISAIKAHRFTAWLVLKSGVSKPLGQIEVETLDDAAWACVSAFSQRGNVFNILHDDDALNRRTIRTVQVKCKSKPIRKWDHATQRMETVGAEYPYTLAEYRVERFAPELEFDAFRDDPTGHDNTLVEVPS